MSGLRLGLLVFLQDATWRFGGFLPLLASFSPLTALAQVQHRLNGEDLSAGTKYVLTSWLSDIQELAYSN